MSFRSRLVREKFFDFEMKFLHAAFKIWQMHLLLIEMENLNFNQINSICWMLLRFIEFSRMIKFELISTRDTQLPSSHYQRRVREIRKQRFKMFTRSVYRFASECEVSDKTKLFCCGSLISEINSNGCSQEKWGYIRLSNLNDELAFRLLKLYGIRTSR